MSHKMTCPSTSYMQLHYAAHYYQDNETRVSLAAGDSPVDAARKHKNVQFFVIEETKIDERTGKPQTKRSGRNYLGFPSTVAALAHHPKIDHQLLTFLEKEGCTHAVQTQDGAWHALKREDRAYDPETGDLAL